QSLPVIARYSLPTFGVHQELSAFLRRHVGEFPERADALAALFGRKFFECLQSSVHFGALAVRKNAQDSFLLFLRQFKELLEAVAHPLTLVVGRASHEAICRSSFSRWPNVRSFVRLNFCG